MRNLLRTLAAIPIVLVAIGFLFSVLRLGDWTYDRLIVPQIKTMNHTQLSIFLFLNILALIALTVLAVVIISRVLKRYHAT